MLSGSARGNAAKTITRLVGVSAAAGVLVAAVAFPAVGGAGIAARDAANGFQAMPSELETPPLPQRSRILAADGSALATFYYENRISVPFDKIAPVMRDAIVAIEDSRFYQHDGVDYEGVMRAMVVNARAGEVRQGGSSITQQYVENVLVERADSKDEARDIRSATMGTKLREMRYALAIEEQLTKDEILQRYLNIAYFGDGAYGVEAAARHFFGRTAAKLELHQAALLAGQVRSPHAYNPTLYPEAAKERRDVVLTRMAQLGTISHQEATEAQERPLDLDVRETRNGCVGTKAPFFCDYVLNEIKTNPVFGKTAEDRIKLLERGGLTIRTTLEWKAQRAAKRALRRYVPPKAQKASALASVEPGTGKIKAIATSKRYGTDTKKAQTTVNLAADYAHGGNTGAQPGSTFKPFTLLTALREGIPYGGVNIGSPNSMTLRGFRTCDGSPITTPWSVSNAGDSTAGTFNLLTGTWNSVNTFFAQLERRVGLCDAVRTARQFGMVQANGEALPEFPSFTLGSPEVDPVHLAAAYAGFGARGKYCKPIVVTAIKDPAGRSLEVPQADCKRVVSPQVADALTYVLQGVLTRGTAAGRGIGRPAAGKTGTTDNYSAAWFAGYTPDLATAVWVGDPRGGQQHPLNGQGACIGGTCYGIIYGATLPAPIWQMAMRAAHAGEPASQFQRPPSRFFAGLSQGGDDDDDGDRGRGNNRGGDRGGGDRGQGDGPGRGFSPGNGQGGPGGQGGGPGGPGGQGGPDGGTDDGGN